MRLTNRASNAAAKPNERRSRTSSFRASSPTTPRTFRLKLTMLGAKTSAKDRWRQVIQEADRIELKHLATMEPAVSVDQTNEMTVLRVQLVVPQEVQLTYTVKQRDWLVDIG